MNTFARMGFVAAVLLANCVAASANDNGKLTFPQSGNASLKGLNGLDSNSNGSPYLGRFSTESNITDPSRVYTLEDYVRPSQPSLKESFDSLVSSFSTFMGNLFRFVFTKRVIGPVILVALFLRAIFTK